MAQVTQPTPARRIHDRTNKILSITEGKVIFIRHTDADGAESITMAYLIGEANYARTGEQENRMLGIWANANMKQLQDNLRLVTVAQAKDIIAVLEEKGIVKEGKVVSVAEAAQSTLPDVSGAFDDLDDKPAADDKKG